MNTALLLYAIAFCTVDGCFREHSVYTSKTECEMRTAQQYRVNGEVVPNPSCIEVDGEIIPWGGSEPKGTGESFKLKPPSPLRRSGTIDKSGSFHGR